MATDVGVGDIEVPYLDVTPGSVTTAGTLTVTDPAGTDTTPTVTAGTPSGGTVRLTATAVTYDAPGRWLLHWDVTGTGAGAEDQEVYVVASPVAGGPTWMPGRSRVANYVPGRTLSVDSTTHELTFSSTTRPTGVQVDRLLADAVSWVTMRVGTVDATLTDQAAACAALWAAAAVERGYPDDDDDALARAQQLQKLAEQMREDLAAANAAAGEPPVDAGSALLPLYAFPAAPTWADLDL